MQISDAEWDVMSVLWESEPKTAAEVIASLAPSHSWNHRTVRTLLARLIEKGALTYEANGVRYSYCTAVSQTDCVRQRSQSFLAKVFGGNASALVAHFVEDGQLSVEDIDELARLLKSKKASRKSKRRS